jgi:hypothetical protein
MEHFRVKDAALCIRSGFVAVPALRLTLTQAQRLWNFDERVCEAVLDILVELRFLRKTHDGTYERREMAA